MKYQIPLDLIDQIQINLKIEANLTSFNQLNSPIPPLPTIEQAISSIDLSSDNSNCNNCNGPLLRGFESLICIYCGLNNQQKSIPQSIPFKSTLGFRVLLDSLGLDPSESVGSPSDDVPSNKGQTSLKDEISLADLLNLDLKWPDEFNRNDVKKDEIYPKKRFSNLVGEDIDSHLGEGNSRDHDSRVSIEHVTIQGIDNNKPPKSREQNTESYESVHGEQGESFTWEAEFQSVNQNNTHENLQSSNNISILPKTEGEIDSNLIYVDQSSNSGPVISPSKIARSTEDVYKNSIADSPNDENIPDDDANNEWGEFRAVAGPESIRSKPSIAEINMLQSNDFAQLNSQTDKLGLQSPEISFGIQDDHSHDRGIESPTRIGDSFDFWNDFKSSSVETHETSNIGEDDKIHYSVGETTIDSWNDIASSSTSKKVDGLSSAEVVPNDRNGTHDDSFFSTSDNFGAWSNLTGSTVTDDMSIGVDHSPRPWNDLSYLTETHADQNQDSGTQADKGHSTFENSGLLDSWGDFRSSNTQLGNSIPGPKVTEFTHGEIRAKTAPESQIITANNDETFDLWGNFGPSTLASKTESQATGAEFSEKNSTDVDSDFFNGWNYSGNSNGITVNGGTSFTVNDDVFDSWSEFAKPVNVQSNSSVSKPANDPFDTWKTFASSSGGQIHGDTAVINESASVKNLFEIGADLQGVGSSSFVQGDQLFATVGDKECPSQVASEVPDLFGMENGDVKADVHAELMNQSGTTTKPSHPSSSDVETLISEMHDLSFMLETTLTVPSSES